MAVYTRISSQDLDTLLARYQLPTASNYQGASDGIENSTYFVNSGEQAYILTIFEELSAEQLPFFTRLMHWLAERNLPVACPLTDATGVVIQQVADKPALLFPRLTGSHPKRLDALHIHQIGDFLGRMHAETQHYPEQRQNPRGRQWLTATATQLQTALDDERRAWVAQATALSETLASSELPRGLIHGDLFHDNALFDGEQLTGVIDFYAAGTDILALDLAIVANDWCGLPQGGVDPGKTAILLAAYQSHRALSAPEQTLWPQLLQLAAARFWFSRLQQELFPAHGVTHLHKPSQQYLQHFLAHSNNA